MWFLLGTKVTAQCLTSVLGISPRSLFKRCRGEKDGRRGAVPCRGRGDGATLIVDQYMHELYWSAAEDLPETVRLDDVDQCIERNDLSDAQKEKLTSHQRAFIDGGAIPQWSPNECAADLLAKASNHGEKVLPPRPIQHCHLRDLWWAFLAWFLALPAVASDSNATFQPMRCPS